MQGIRIQKWISQMGIASRREAESWIYGKRLKINGKIAQVGDKVDPNRDTVEVDGKKLKVKKPPLVYWMLYKPDKVLTSRASEEGKMTIFDLPALKKLPFLVSPVGRLDFRTEGLLLLSNDGELVHRLMHPRYEIPRTYQVLLTKPLNREQMDKIRSGSGLYPRVGKVELKALGSVKLGKSKGYWYRVVVCEGRNRVVRRLFEAVNQPPHQLMRTSYAGLSMPHDLKPGEYRQLTSSQIRALKAATDLLESSKGHDKALVH